MKCDVCQEQVATTHLTEIINKKKKELHLCDECARRQGATIKSSLLDVGAPTMVVSHPPSVPKAAKLVLKGEELAGASCPACGMTFTEFRGSGRLGCANDYVAFRRGLVPLLDKIHGEVEHKGKIPAHATERLERQKEIGRLRQELNRAIQREEYEAAAELRDRIYRLEEPGA